jgi:AcrR family transcriptional regulator
MPKVVDRGEQRRQIGAALLGIVARAGFDEVSVRTVAAAAGRSAGAVQKYFATKEEMLHFALELANERTLERMAAVSRDGPPRDQLRELVCAGLPLDPERRAEATVWFSYAVAAVHEPRLAAVLAEIDAEVLAALAAWLEEIGAPGDPHAVARAVVAVSDGLALTMLHQPDTTEACLAALDVTLTALLAGSTQDR